MVDMVDRVGKFRLFMNALPLVGALVYGLEKVFRSQKALLAISVAVFEAVLASTGDLEIATLSQHIFTLAVSVIVGRALEDASAKRNGSFKPS